jgi:dihydropteroate synthase
MIPPISLRSGAGRPPHESTGGDPSGAVGRTPVTPIVPGLPAADRCLVMGILNVTSDSFSDGGDYMRTDRAIARGFELFADGADLVDVGGESTRPGARRVPVDVEMGRVIPVVRELAAAGQRVSVDTMRAEVASAAVTAGACLVNDVSGGLGDPAMPARVASLGVPYVAMHWRAPSSEMHRFASYTDVVMDVVNELRARLEALVASGVSPDMIILDPGLGFAKTAEQNWELLAGLRQLTQLGRPLLIGASRKSFLGDAVAYGADVPPPRLRDAATIAVTSLAAAAGVYCVRVHDVKGSRQATGVARELTRARLSTKTKAATL